ncbi:hypothetical protein RCOM_2017100, partial [Ricinus communis]
VPEDYRARLQVAADRGLLFICANPDRVVQRGDKLIFCAGALADLYEELGGKVVMAGKPYAAIYDLALAEAERLKGGPVDRSRVLCIGDGVITDVLGAENQKLACLFVAKGIHGDKALGPDGLLAPEAVAKLLAAESVGATHAIAAEFSRTVGEADIQAFADVTGDTNPVHLDANYAATTSFGERIAHGMLSAGYISAALGTTLPGPGAVYLSQS